MAHECDVFVVVAVGIAATLLLVSGLSSITTVVAIAPSRCMRILNATGPSRIQPNQPLCFVGRH